VGTSSGIYRYEPSTKKFQKLHLDPQLDQAGIYVFCLVQTGHKQLLWIGSHRGAWIFDGKNASRVRQNGIQGNPVYAITQAQDGRIWAAGFGDGICILNAEGSELYRQIQDKGLERTQCLFGAGDGTVYAGTQAAGLAVFRGAEATLTWLSETDGLPHNRVQAVISDFSGNIWAATSGGGVARLREQLFRHYGPEDGLLGPRVYALQEDRLGRIWMSTAQNGIQILDSTGLVPVPRDSGRLKGVKCKTIAEDLKGNIWVGTDGRGIAVIGPRNTRMLTKDNGGIPANYIQKILCDASGSIWAATAADGIVRLTTKDSVGYTYKVIGKTEGLTDPAISTMQFDNKGNVWFGTVNGRIGWISNGRVEHLYGPETGLPASTITSIAFDQAGNCWTGFKGDGIWVAPLILENKETAHFRPVNTPQKMHSKIIYLLVFDRQQNLWAGTENGVDELVLDKHSITVSDLLHFGKNEGFRGIETCQDAAICDRGGNLWFGTMNGLTKYVPTNRKLQSAAPLIHFQEISLHYKSISGTPYGAYLDSAGSGLKEGLELPWDQNHLSFNFKGIDMVNTQQVRYRWKLMGADTGWSPLSEQNEVHYANLAPGTYRFMIQATGDGILFSKPLAAPFTILKPYWMHWEFQLFVLLLLTGLVALIAMQYVGRVKKAEEIRRTRLEVENRLLQLEQKALQLQMNPHFIFNALNSIQSLISTRDYDTARQEINGFAKLMRSILTNSRRQYITLREEIDTLEQYLKIEQFCQQNAFTFAISLNDAIDPEAVEIPPMMLQPFVENAVIHGVSHLQYAGHIEMRFELQGELLTCTIRDNGVGREKAALLRQTRKPGHQSTALQVTRERLEAIRGTHNYQPLLISDILNEHKTIAGTEVVIIMPVEMKY
jgi:ligand-binding sensor domain-containing protein/two-component sensor histidine kinase